ncbi:HAD family hydrolase [Granulicella tundricola]|uniref:Haloacid dehalogenase domain protein hydrolase n=1 Tax=Granulicella tundricola (strain ATCC BAA-1859 / DSM 23138 / MP5ACTX9) TaxID=1198114 RepID=E8WXJ7_GRATM|nr:haloacid dehalogenase-like hydrolase [Granulicella tundricola]ADW68613.1 Haloacid dehalogenase domain protein hydrolase [Granulicella tundricola MP5ACTX9]
MTATHLSTEAFESSITHIAPRTAVFDCDGTLWSGDAGSSFMVWTIETGLLSTEAVNWLNDRYQGYKAGQVSELAICGEMVQVYRGIPEATMRAAAAEFFSTRIEPNIFPELARVIANLQATGTDIWAVSSTNDWVIEEGVRRFNIPANRVLSARVAIENGIVTDKVLDVPTDQGKVDSLRRAGILTPDAVFGNSVHDAAMLAIARQAYPVNPTPALIDRSAAEGWPVYFPASVRPI